MNPQTFFDEDQADGHAEPCAVTMPEVYADEGDAKPESTGGYLEKITARLLPEGKAKMSHKRLAMASILFLYHAGQFPGQTIPTLAKQFNLTKAGLYKLSAAIYGRGFGIGRRLSTENMRKARLRCLDKRKPRSANSGALNEVGSVTPIDGLKVNGGAA